MKLVFVVCILLGSIGQLYAQEEAQTSTTDSEKSEEEIEQEKQQTCQKLKRRIPLYEDMIDYHTGPMMVKIDHDLDKTKFLLFISKAGSKIVSESIAAALNYYFTKGISGIDNIAVSEFMKVLKKVFEKDDFVNEAINNAFEVDADNLEGIKPFVVDRENTKSTTELILASFEDQSVIRRSEIYELNMYKKQIVDEEDPLKKVDLEIKYQNFALVLVSNVFQRQSEKPDFTTKGNVFTQAVRDYNRIYLRISRLLADVVILDQLVEKFLDKFILIGCTGPINQSSPQARQTLH